MEELLKELNNTIKKFEDNLGANTFLIKDITEDLKVKVESCVNELKKYQEISVKMESAMYELYILNSAVKEILIQKKICNVEELSELVTKTATEAVAKFNEFQKQNTEQKEGTDQSI